MKIEFRKFTREGSQRFAELLLNRTAGIFAELDSLCKDDSKTVKLNQHANWDENSKTRLEMATFLWDVFGTSKPLAREADDPLLWDWIACRLFASLHDNDETVVTSAQARKESNVRWIVEEGKLRQHRHLILGPFTAYKGNESLGSEYFLSQLAQPILAPGEVVERISGKIQLSHGEVAKLTTWLYVEPKSKSIRSGITAEGSPQLLSKYFNQIEKTVDYQSMSAKELIEMLPPAFAKWVNLAKKDYTI